MTNDEQDIKRQCHLISATLEFAQNWHSSTPLLSKYNSSYVKIINNRLWILESNIERPEHATLATNEGYLS